MEIIYIADDGTKFDDEDECLAHERKIRMRKANFAENIRLFSKDKEEFIFIDSDDYERAFFMEILTDEAAAMLEEWVREECNSYMFNNKTIPTAGRFYFDETNDEWVNVEELRQKYEDINAIFNGEA